VRALSGAVITLVLSNVLVRQGLGGGVGSTVLGAVLLAAIGFDIKWQKNRHKILQKTYVSPAYLDLHPRAAIHAGSDSPYAINNRLKDVEVLALGLVDGPEDVILDRQGRLYTGMRQGVILRFSGTTFDHREVFADIGGRPLGMAFDRRDNLVVCVAGMGLYAVRPSGEVFKLTDQAKRSAFSIRDDAMIRLADDLDIAPDGKIYFSDASLRYDLHSWAFDGIEGRPNGRILCFDPETRQTRTVVRRQIFPNGICVEPDGRSLLFATSYGCQVLRFWLAGTKKGSVETVIDLPGHPDNINRSSDGHYWLAMVGMRSPVWDLAMRMPGFRTRMVKRVPRDEWLAPNLNCGCVVKFSANGTILDCLWDAHGIHNPAITSMREHRGWLYLGGLTSNRITRIKLDRVDESWTGPDAYWGTQHQASSE
jgi:ribose transport system permease protein